MGLILNAITTRSFTDKIDWNEANRFRNKRVRFVFHILRSLGIMFSSRPWGIGWEKRYWSHWRGEALYFTKFLIPNLSDPHIRSLSWVMQAKLVWNLLKGTCHGTCCEFIRAIRDNPGIELENLDLNKENIALFQSFEFLRAQREEETIQNFQPKNIVRGNRNIPLNECFRNSDILLLRCWRGSNAHTFLLYADESNQHFYFLNSKGRGLFRFNTQAELVEAFTSHLQAQSPFMKEGTAWQIENY